MKKMNAIKTEIPYYTKAHLNCKKARHSSMTKDSDFAYIFGTNWRSI